MFSKFFAVKKIEELNDLDFVMDKKDIQNDVLFDENTVNDDEDESKKKAKTVKNEVLKGKKHYEGHRKRLKEKLLNHSLELLPDYEILEGLLTYTIPRSDVKPLAKQLLDKFKTLKNLVLANSVQIASVSGLGDNAVCFFKILSEIYCRFEKIEILEDISLNSPEKVAVYCQSRMGFLKHEQFRVLFLNKKNRLIKDLIIQNGTIDRAAIFPRELILQALQLGAGGLILAHNHPSGDPSPSTADIEITEAIKKAANLMEIALFDHLIIAKNAYYSMKAHKIF